MTVADLKKKEHIIDHLLYCWQMEDLVRASQFQPVLLQQWAAKQAEEAGTDPEAEERWLLKMAHSLRDSGAKVQGHCSEVQETMMELAHLHELLMNTVKDADYIAAFEASKPFLDELSSKSGQNVHPVEQLTIGMYGWLLLRIQKQDISAETEAAMVGLRNWANALAKGHLKVYQGG